MKPVQPAPFYRCYFAQVWLVAAVFSLWLHWHAVAIDSQLSAHYGYGETWWYVLELVVRFGLLPLLTSLLFATASYILDRESFTGLSFLAGPVVAIARLLVFDETTIQQWMMGGAGLLLAGHYSAKIRIYWATLLSWFNASMQREQVLGEYNSNVRSLVTALSAVKDHLLPQELSEFKALHPEEGNFHHIFAPSVREAKRELRSLTDRLQELLQVACRRRDEAVAQRRRTLEKRRTQLRPLYEDRCKRNTESYGRFVWSLGFDLFEQQPTADEWRVLSSDKINYYADSVQQFLVDSATETGGEAANVRTRTENILRVHYRDNAELVEQHLGRQEFNGLLAAAREIDDVSEYVDHVLAIQERVSILAIRQGLVNYFLQFAAVLQRDLPLAEFNRQLDDLISERYPLRLVQTGEEELRHTLDTLTKPTREEIERREELVRQQRRQELRCRFQAILLSNLQKLQRLTCEIQEAERAAITPTQRHDYIVDCRREIEHVEGQLAVFREEDPDLFDEVRQQLDSPVVAA